jgi:hypothetical protein
MKKNTFDAASIYLTYESLKKVNRPQGDESWVFMTQTNSLQTGTSFVTFVMLGQLALQETKCCWLVMQMVKVVQG